MGGCAHRSSMCRASMVKLVPIFFIMPLAAACRLDDSSIAGLGASITPRLGADM
jgi:hypothetical protein